MSYVVLEASPSTCRKREIKLPSTTWSTSITTEQQTTYFVASKFQEQLIMVVEIWTLFRFMLSWLQVTNNGTEWFCKPQWEQIFFTATLNGKDGNNPNIAIRVCPCWGWIFVGPWMHDESNAPVLAAHHTDLNLIWSDEDLLLNSYVLTVGLSDKIISFFLQCNKYFCLQELLAIISPLEFYHEQYSHGEKEGFMSFSAIKGIEMHPCVLGISHHSLI